jgi:hypothetical protein
MRLSYLLILAGGFYLLQSCETKDVEPPPGSGAQVLLSVSPNVISENGGTAVLTASLTASTNQDVTCVLDFSGTAVQAMDYTISSAEIVITAGNISGSIAIAAIDDSLKIGNRSVVIDIASVINAQHDGLQAQTLTIEDDDLPPTVSLLINEVLYDPSNNGLDGDANGDGSYAQNEDEFIEFINLSTQPLDLSGFKIYDAEALAANSPGHEFPPGSIVAPGKAIVVFGGGTPTGSFGGAVVQTSTSGDMNLNNAGDFVTVTDTAGTVIVTFDIEPLSNNPNESYTRNPDITGEFEQHSDNTSLLFSPGTKIDGAPF